MDPVWYDSCTNKNKPIKTKQNPNFLRITSKQMIMKMKLKRDYVHKIDFFIGEMTSLEIKKMTDVTIPMLTRLGYVRCFKYDHLNVVYTKTASNLRLSSNRESVCDLVRLDLPNPKVWRSRWFAPIQEPIQEPSQEPSEAKNFEHDLGSR